LRLLRFLVCAEEGARLQLVIWFNQALAASLATKKAPRIIEGLLGAQKESFDNPTYIWLYHHHAPAHETA
jgi:hypothetical protein